MVRVALVEIFARQTVEGSEHHVGLGQRSEARAMALVPRERFLDEGYDFRNYTYARDFAAGTSSRS